MIFSGIKSKERWRRTTWTNFQRYTSYVVSFGLCCRSLVLFVLARHKSLRKYINKRNFITTWSCIMWCSHFGIYNDNVQMQSYVRYHWAFFCRWNRGTPEASFGTSDIWQVQFPLRHAFPSPRSFECLVARFWMITTLLVCCCPRRSKKSICYYFMALRLS